MSRSCITCAGCSRDHGYEREGEADVVIGDPDRGILVIEVKAGEIRRDADGALVGRPSACRDRPFEQAADSRHALVRKLRELPDWPAGLEPDRRPGRRLPGRRARLDARATRAASGPTPTPT